MLRFPLQTCVLIVSVLTTRVVFSTIYTWIGPGGGDWSTGGIGALMVLLTAGDTAQFTSTATPSLSEDVGINTISATAGLTISGTNMITFDNGGSLQVNTASAVNINVNVGLDLSGSSTALTITQAGGSTISIPASGNSTVISSINTGAPNAITINGVAAVNADIVFAGTGSNTYAGATIVNSGHLGANKTVANATAIPEICNF